MLELPKNRTLAGFRRLLATPNITVTRTQTTRRGEHVGGHNHELHHPYIPNPHQTFKNGVDLLGTDPIKFVMREMWTFERSVLYPGAIIAIKRLPHGDLETRYRIELPNALDDDDLEPDGLDHTDRAAEWDIEDAVAHERGDY